MTRDDAALLARVLGVPFLALHALAAFWGAKVFLSLPMEAGGLVFGPILGFPLAGVGAAFLFAAVLLVMRTEPYFVMAAAFVALMFDGFFLMTLSG